MRKRSCRRRRRRRGKKRERQRQVKMGQHLPHMAVQREYGGRQVSRDGMGTQNKKIVPPTNPTLGLSVYYSLPIYTPASFHRKEMYMTALPNSGQTHGKQLYPLSLSLSLEPIKRSIYYLTRPDEVSSLINCHCSLPFFFYLSESIEFYLPSPIFFSYYTTRSVSKFHSEKLLADSEANFRKILMTLQPGKRGKGK